MRINKETVKKMYLDYYNNFASLNNFADYYKVTPKYAARIIQVGRKLCNRTMTKTHKSLLPTRLENKHFQNRPITNDIYNKFKHL